YNEEYQQIGHFLETLKRPENLSGQDYLKLKRKASKYLLFGGEIFKREKDGVPRRVITDKKEQKRVIREVHDNSG
ncbi:hypothetical protein BKA69DRAFT_1013917, partial [Paraphysoderma sedebokerense]